MTVTVSSGSAPPGHRAAQISPGEAHLALRTAGGDDRGRLPDEGLRADFLGLASNPAVPEGQLAEEKRERARETHEVPWRGKQKQQHERDDGEHALSLSDRRVFEPVP